jgi:SAM-dependent methyltransferase
LEKRDPLTTSLSIDVEGVDREKCFQLFSDYFSKIVGKSNASFDARPGGIIKAQDCEIGRVAEINSKEIAIDWPHDDNPTKITFSFEDRGKDTRIILRWDRSMDGDSAIGWFAEKVAWPFLQASSSRNFGDWLTDRKARKPSGAEARNTYADPLYHKPNFLAILNALQLKQDDFLLEVGCGGGVLLGWALKSGCRARAIDHSPDMVDLAKATNAEAIREKRLEIVEAEADNIPFHDSMFTCAVSTGVFAFIADPEKAISEVYRVLKDGGRYIMFTGSKRLRGTPAAPEPIASRLHFYEDEELVELARIAGFGEARVDHPDLSVYARQVGVPEDAVESLFRSDEREGQLLIALKRVT